MKYGTDKPDLKSLIINDITEIFTRDDVSFEIFKKLVNKVLRLDVLLLIILKIDQEVFLTI